MKRNRYKLVRRSDKWVVRATYGVSAPGLEWLDQTSAYKIMVSPQSSDYDFWFHSIYTVTRQTRRCGSCNIADQHTIKKEY